MPPDLDKHSLFMFGKNSLQHTVTAQIQCFALVVWTTSVTETVTHAPHLFDHIDLNITLAEEYITSTTNIKFLGLIIDENLSWKCHIEQTLMKLSSACYAMKVVTPLMGDTTVRMIYFAYVHSLLSYGITLWGNSPHS
jgi:hypothetical protein